MAQRETPLISYRVSPSSIRIGERLRFTGTREHWGPDLTENAEADLDLGEIYTLREMMVYSSFTTITLEETYSTYSLIFFEHVVSKESMLLEEAG